MRHAILGGRRLLTPLSLLAAGCVGLVAGKDGASDRISEGDRRSENGIGESIPPSDASPDRAPADRATDVPASDACTPEDAVTTCDPLAASPCSKGAGCYVVKGTYVDCICPAGTIDEGSACNAAVECKPHLTCFSSTSTPPGTCRTLCDVQSPSCPTGQSCTAIPNFPSLGYCHP